MNVPRSPVYLAAARRGAGMARSGVSLMEVLISVFVISIGLLGIAALIPVANYALRESSKADRSAACGQAAMRDIRVRALVDPMMWLPYDDDNIPTLFAAGDTYAIDPLGSVDTFGGVHKDTDLSAALPPVFVWRDDRTFHMPEDGSRPTRAEYGGQDYQGDYSWMFTVTPSPAEDYNPDWETGGDSKGWRNRRHVTVSVAVFYKRDFTGSDIVINRDASIMSNVAGAVHLQLNGDPKKNVNIAGKEVRLPDFEPGEWILLSGLRVNNATGAPTVLGQWYRIVAGWGDNLSLEGPVWTGGTDAHAVFIPGVLGVYTTSVELNRSPEWMR